MPTRSSRPSSSASAPYVRATSAPTDEATEFAEAESAGSKAAGPLPAVALSRRTSASPSAYLPRGVSPANADPAHTNRARTSAATRCFLIGHPPSIPHVPGEASHALLRWDKYTRCGLLCLRRGMKTDEGENADAKSASPPVIPGRRSFAAPASETTGLRERTPPDLRRRTPRSRSPVYRAARTLSWRLPSADAPTTP